MNGDRAERIPGNLNIAFEGLSAEGLIGALPDVALATGSACTSASVEPSYVLRALGLPDELAVASLRVGFGRETTLAEVETAARRIAAAVRQMRAASHRAAE